MKNVFIFVSFITFLVLSINNLTASCANAYFSNEQCDEPFAMGVFNVMKQIPLNTIQKTSKRYKNSFALVDDEDYEMLMKYRWHISKGRSTLYVHGDTIVDGKRKTICMHRFIMGVTDPKIKVDHRDHDGLNNQRYNLRACTHQQNCMNKRKYLTNPTSKYLGVSLKKIYITKNGSGTKKWIAQIKCNNTKYSLGTFKTEIEAAYAYDEAAKKRFGEFANLNFK